MLTVIGLSFINVDGVGHAESVLHLCLELVQENLTSGWLFLLETQQFFFFVGEKFNNRGK